MSLNGSSQDHRFRLFWARSTLIQLTTLPAYFFPAFFRHNFFHESFILDFLSLLFATFFQVFFFLRDVLPNTAVWDTSYRVYVTST